MQFRLDTTPSTHNSELLFTFSECQYWNQEIHGCPKLQTPPALFQDHSLDSTPISRLKTLDVSFPWVIPKIWSFVRNRFLLRDQTSHMHTLLVDRRERARLVCRRALKGSDLWKTLRPLLNPSPTTLLNFLNNP